MADNAAQIYLILDCAAGDVSSERLDALLAVAVVPSLLLRPDPDRKPGADALRSLAARAQDRGTAVLIADDIAMAHAIGADGVHLTAADAADDESLAAGLLARYGDARRQLGDTAIVGIAVAHSRHAAMSLAEAGADYVAFTPSTASTAMADDDDDDDDEPASQRELVAWWSEIFEVPVVGFDVADSDAARDLAAAGADFVAVRVPVALPPSDLQGWLRDILDALEAGPAAVGG